jgi:hypothetical protein
VDPSTFGEFSFFDRVIKPGDVIAVECVTTDHHFEAIVVGWVMTSCDHNARASTRVSVLQSKYWRWNHANVDDINSSAQ